MFVVLRPLSADAKATLTTKPGKDPNIPQADVSISVGEVAVHMDKLQVCVCVCACVCVWHVVYCASLKVFVFITSFISSQQFQGVVNLAESLDRMTVNTRYRKYKPPVEMKDQYKLWWVAPPTLL